jgi:hypothetical protein
MLGRKGFYTLYCPKCGEKVNWDERGRYHAATWTEACAESGLVRHLEVNGSGTGLSHTVPPSPLAAPRQQS